MILEWLTQLGAWNWIILGAALLALEILVPGVYLLWIGVAAILTGTLTFQLGESTFLGWQVQVVVFLVLSVFSAFLGKHLLQATRGDDTDQPLLNQRDLQLVGRIATLEEAISNGTGRVRLGDTLWRVRGPDLPAGTRVRIVRSEDGQLFVEKDD